MWPFRKKRDGAFYYKVAGKRSSIDGMRACTELEKDTQFRWEDIDILLEPGPSGEPLAALEQRDSEAAVQSAFRRVFEMPEYDNGKGFTDSEVLQVVADFTIWVYELKKNIESSRTSAPPIPESASSSTEKNGSPSGSSNLAPSIAKQV